MKKTVLLCALLLGSGLVAAQVSIDRLPLGTGTPGVGGQEMAIPWDNGLYHAPQYMPGYPTAATIFPRAVTVLCVQNLDALSCKGYNWLPEMGRAEYLMIHPVVVNEMPNQQ
jgi:hypothetical protein